MSEIQNLISKITSDIKSAETGISMLEGYLQGKGVLSGPLVLRGPLMPAELPAPSLSCGENVRALRKLYKFTKGQVAELCGVTSFEVSCWEHEKWEPDSKTLVMLADYFGVSVDYLLGRRGK